MAKYVKYLIKIDYLCLNEEEDLKRTIDKVAIFMEKKLIFSNDNQTINYYKDKIFSSVKFLYDPCDITPKVFKIQMISQGIKKYIQKSISLFDFESTIKFMLDHIRVLVFFNNLESIPNSEISNKFIENNNSNQSIVEISSGKTKKYESKKFKKQLKIQKESKNNFINIENQNLAIGETGETPKIIVINSEELIEIDTSTTIANTEERKNSSKDEIKNNTENEDEFKIKLQEKSDKDDKLDEFIKEYKKNELKKEKESEEYKKNELKKEKESEDLRKIIEELKKESELSKKESEELKNEFELSKIKSEELKEKELKNEKKSEELKNEFELFKIKSEDQIKKLNDQTLEMKNDIRHLKK